MPRTQLTTREIGSVQRDDLDVTTAGQAVVRKIIAGTNITISQTGVDNGTGDVTINASSSGGATENWVALTANFTLGNVNTVQAVFPAANDVVALDATSTYFFEAVYDITTGTTTKITRTVFAYTGTLTSGYYQTTWYASAANGIATASSLSSTSTITTAKDINTTNTTVHNRIRLRGVIRTNTAGNLTPQIQFSAAPGGTNTMNANSYFRIWKAGTNTAQFGGSWS